MRFSIGYFFCTFIVSQSLICCENFIHLQEKSLGIPTGLLSSIALTESGHGTDASNHKKTWPWVINVGGKSFFFKNKKEALSKITSLWKKGIRSIDVGCMQINLKYHPHAFKNLSEAFEPSKNVAYAASFLKELKEKTGSWYTALGYYHSKNPHYYRTYQKKVMKEWETIKNRFITYTPFLGTPSKKKKTTLLNSSPPERKSHAAFFPFIPLHGFSSTSKNKSYALAKTRRINLKAPHILNGKTFYPLKIR